MTGASFGLAVHGGAAVISRSAMTQEKERALRAGLEASLTAGYQILRDGGSALDAVTVAVIVLEDDPLFNAGRGAVFTAAGTLEMDAAVMDGCSRKAGAVAGVLGPRNPVLAARAVMDRSEQVLLTGEGAVSFCKQQGVALAGFDYFYTGHRWQELQELLAAPEHQRQMRPGTVGAVARDRQGALAAATSTGGITGKPVGRVGDTPIFGAGTWADDICAVSATGAGEYFIRWAVAHEIAARLRYTGDQLQPAARAVIAELDRNGGKGGVIAIDRTGAVALPFNGEGMYRGQIGPDGVALTAIHDGDLT
jgi:beta-aspartyl-peptidase (threonine type)